MNDQIITMQEDGVEIILKTDNHYVNEVTESSKSHFYSSATKAAKEISRTLASGSYNVILSPKLQDGINSGIYSWDEVSVMVKNTQTGKFAGQIKLEKVDKTFQMIGNSISIISGEMQMMQIADELKAINEKLDDINHKIDAMQQAKLISGLKAISQYISSGKKSFLYTAIDKLNEISEYYKQRCFRKIKSDISSSRWHILPFSNKGKREDLIASLRYMNEAIENYHYFQMAYIGAHKAFQVIKGEQTAFKEYTSGYSELKELIATKINYYLYSNQEANFDEILSGNINQELFNTQSKNICDNMKYSISLIEGQNKQITASPIKQIEVKLEV